MLSRDLFKSFSLINRSFHFSNIPRRLLCFASFTKSTLIVGYKLFHKMFISAYTVVFQIVYKTSATFVEHKHNACMFSNKWKVTLINAFLKEHGNIIHKSISILFKYFCWNFRSLCSLLETFFCKKYQLRICRNEILVCHYYFWWLKCYDVFYTELLVWKKDGWCFSPKDHFHWTPQFSGF